MYEKIAAIHKGQDGAIWNNYLFRFDSDGKCYVYDLSKKLNGSDILPVSVFEVNHKDLIMPHSNSVSFSTEFFCKTDEFPLLFSNVYNSYAKCDVKREGTCCVYRITRNDEAFSADLTAIIEIDFVNNSELWCSPHIKDIRPYGNFAVDRKNGKLFVYTMRDEQNTTRYFSFQLPKIAEAKSDFDSGIKKITLQSNDIEYFFDTEYHHFLQGVCIDNDIIYSLEGFTNDIQNPPALRMISAKERKQLAYYKLEDYGLSVEPELIDFFDGKCYYCDHSGNLFLLKL